MMVFYVLAFQVRLMCVALHVKLWIFLETHLQIGQNIKINNENIYYIFDLLYSLVGKWFNLQYDVIFKKTYLK